MKSFVLIPAPNGLGHIHRLLRFSELLERFGYQAELIVPSYCLSNNQTALKLRTKKFSVISWHQNTIKDAVSLGDYVNLIGNIVCDKIVISDNIIEVLDRYKNSYLYANFFHHEVENVSVNQSYSAYLQDIILKNSKRIFTNKKFHHFLKSEPRYFHKTKFLDISSEALTKRTTGILFSVGTTKLVTKTELKFLGRLVSSFDRLMGSIYVDPRIISYMPEITYPTFSKATYTEEMYNDIKLAFVRPGLSTIQNLIKVGATINPLIVGINNEILSNSNTISTEGIGTPLYPDFILKTPLTTTHKTYSPNRYLYTSGGFANFIKESFKLD